MLILIVASGPDKGRVYEVPPGGSAVLGREGDPIRLSDRKASRQHARLWAEGESWYLEDCNSRHGTFHNGQCVDHRIALHDGDRVQMGNTVFVLARLSATQTEQAERRALLGEPPDPAEAAGLAMPGQTRRRYALMVGGSLAAAVALLLGVNVYFNAHAFNAAHDQTSQLQRTLNEVLDQRLAGLETAAVESRESVVAEVRQIEQADAQQREALEQVLAALRGQQDQVETIRQSLAQAAQPDEPLMQAVHAQAQAHDLTALREAIEQERAQAAPVLTRLADAADAVESNAVTLAELRGQFEAAALASADTVDHTELTESVKELQAVVTALEGVKEALPRNLTPLMEQVLAAVSSQSPPATAEDDRAQAGAALLAQTMEHLRRLVREEVRSAIGGTDAAAEALSGRADAGAEPAESPSQRTGRSETAHQRLSDTEMAYKLAFETGQPITIGGGVMNPRTGEVAKGRTLDPVAAKAAGITAWRQWYTMDDMAERLRLQRRARQYAEQPGSRLELFTMPEPRRHRQRQDRDDAAVYASPVDEAAPEIAERPERAVAVEARGEAEQ